MMQLVLAGTAFVLLHLVVAGTRLRDLLVARLGERGFRALFSLVSLLALVWVIQAYRGAPYVHVWTPPFGLRWVSFVLMAVAFLLVVIGLTTPSPTAAGGEERLELPEPAQGILRVTRHPVLWGVATWATAHLLVNGDAASIVLFGTFLVIAHVGPRSIDAKRARRYGERWTRFAAVTSNAPFAAILAGRNRFRPGEIGVWRIALALLLFGAVLGHHRLLFGASPYPWP